MTDLVVDRAVLSDLVWRLRQGKEPPRLLQRLNGRLFYERPGMSALERVLFEAPLLSSRLGVIAHREVVPYSETEWHQLDLLIQDAAPSAPVIAAAEDLNRALRGPARAPNEMLEYIARLLLLALGTGADVLLWRPRVSMLDAFLRAVGVTVEPMSDGDIEGRSIGDGLPRLLRWPEGSGQVPRIPRVWLTGGDDVQRAEPVEVFVSYARANRAWATRFGRMLRPLELLGSARVFVDTHIEAGRRWEAEIAAAIDRGEVFVAFVSEYYLSSEFVMQVELPQIVERVDHGQATLWWYLISPCLWEQTALVRIQAAHDVGMPLESIDLHAAMQHLKACATSVAAKYARR